MEKEYAVLYSKEKLSVLVDKLNKMFNRNIHTKPNPTITRNILLFDENTILADTCIYNDPFHVIEPYEIEICLLENSPLKKLIKQCGNTDEIECSSGGKKIKGDLSNFSIDLLV